MNLGIAQQEWVGGLTMLRAIVFDRSFFRSLLFAALIIQIVSSDLVVEIF